MSWTLEAGSELGIKMGLPQDYVFAHAQPDSHLHLPFGGLAAPAQTFGIVAQANDRSDTQAPGIRDQAWNPTGPYFSQRPQAYTFGIPNLDDSAPYIKSQWNYDRQTVLWGVCNNNEDEHWRFKDYGTFSVPCTGINFGSLRPQSTMYFL